MNTASWIALSTLALFALKKWFDLREVLRTIQYHPWSFTVVSSFGLAGALFEKPIRFIARGGARTVTRKYLDFQEAGSDIISAVSLFPKTSATTLIADAATIKDITMHRARFPKPVKQYTALTFFGRNIVASEGDEWKRYRKISAPAFSEPNNRLVWDSTVKIMLDLFDNEWGRRDEIVFDHAVELTLPIALFVIGVAGFGRPIGWSDDLAVPPGHRMSFKESLHLVSTGIFLKAFLPKWLTSWAPTRRIREVKIAYEELEQYMTEMVQARRTAEKKVEQHDLFTSLLDANEDEDDGQAKLADSELLGNIFIFLLAGHETTAHTLCFTFGLLALYQEQQEKLYQQIRSVIPEGRIPTYEDMNLFTESMAVFYETLRLFPPVAGVPKTVAEDTALVTADSFGNKVTVPVLQGTSLVLNIAALHYNPRYWDDPHAFKPERFHGDWPRDAFLPFSGGARSCLGRRFFETEGIAIMTMLVSRYKIEVKEEAEFAGETFAERKERVLRFKRGVTTTPVRMPLVFKRR